MAESAEQDPQHAGALAGGYERLRSAVLSGGAGGWRLGHAVLSASGMVAWMRAVTELAPAANPAPLTPLPAADADQVVAVLAQMMLPLVA